MPKFKSKADFKHSLSFVLTLTHKANTELYYVVNLVLFSELPTVVGNCQFSVDNPFRVR
ncbi:MAG: hypothetical protein ACI94Y_004205 [Maribacter sp.]|jgi:hypothetical protein